MILSTAARRMQFCALALALSAALAPAANAAPDANVIARRADAAMRSALKGKSYQATWQLTRRAGPQGSITIGINLKMVPSKGQTAIKIAPVGQGTGQMQMMAMMLNFTMVDDGKTAYVYLPMQGGYKKEKHSANTSGPQMFNFIDTGKSTYRYVRSETFNGRPTHVIQALPKQPRPGRDQQIFLYIDQATSRPRQIVINETAGGGDGQPTMKTEMKVAIKNEVLGANIPASAFKFVPPPGAKEIQGGAATMNPLGMLFGGRGGGPR